MSAGRTPEGLHSEYTTFSARCRSCSAICEVVNWVCYVVTDVVNATTQEGNGVVNATTKVDARRCAVHVRSLALAMCCRMFSQLQAKFLRTTSAPKIRDADRTFDTTGSTNLSPTALSGIGTFENRARQAKAKEQH